MARPRKDAGFDLWSAAGSPQARLTLGRMSWPDAAQFPVNHSGAKVESVVRPDLLASASVLVVAGFASIAEIVELVAARHSDPRFGVRVLLGTEPFSSQRTSFGSTAAAFDDEVRRYWIEEQNISLRLSAKVVQTLQALEEGHLSVRFVPGSDRLHAKVFLGQHAATVGSSNFTHPGLRTQLEANARFEKKTEPARYRALWQVAENFWEIGEGWDEQFAALLRDMLKFVPWREALARACADLLEGQWADRFLAMQEGTEPLWPSQRFGIAEALWVVENVGSVLVADATGSGKTKMGAHLTAAVRNRLWSTGRVRKDLTVVVCPKSVEQDWLREAMTCGLTARTVPQSLLSAASSDGPRRQEKEVADAQILAVDEAHNFLSWASRRTQLVRDSRADHVLMFTATPINRGAKDLLSLVDLLGADNFDDDTLKVLDNLGRRGHDGTLGPQERDRLRAEIQRFTVRRTKTMLNALVDQDPGAYTDPVTDRMCRYPEHKARSYATSESDHDVDLALQIRAHAHALTGVSLLGTQLSMPTSLRREMSDQQWLELRLGAAQGLAGHHVLAALRSSKAALLEHLRGTDAAVRTLSIANLSKAQATGDQIGSVQAVRDRGRPQVTLRCQLPDWLTDDEAWRRQCSDDLEHYLAIERCVQELDTSREQAKADRIATLAARHPLVIAFDHHPITLAVLNGLLAGRGIDVIVATGGDATGQKKVTKLFAPGSAHRGIALCSDAMNEGVNLQGASCVIHLDMPTTLRVAEQRVGRVDRMNSPHPAVEVWWPKDTKAFATHADELLAARNDESSALLGSNLPIPSSSGAVIDHTWFDEVRNEDWDGLYDALEPVRRLVDGPDPLIPREIYDDQRTARERVMSRVSPVHSSQPWAFFAVAGTKHGAPRWLIVEGATGVATTGLQQVTARLRELLAEDPPQRDFDEECGAWLDRFITAAARAEVRLLPRRDQRALAQMANCAQAWSGMAWTTGDVDNAAERWATIARAARGEAEDGSIDQHEAAAAWLEVTRERREAYRATHRKKRYITLSDLDAGLAARPLPLAQVEAALSGLQILPSLDRRISACILGVPNYLGPDGRPLR
jgi:hypothetical protein